jgi:DNA-binding XRE family transcriptional regulator
MLIGTSNQEGGFVLRVSIKAMRIHRNMTQLELANALKVNKKTVNLWENGKTVPGVDKIEPICTVLRCSYDDIEWSH